MGDPLSQYYPPRAGRLRVLHNICRPLVRWLDRYDLKLPVPTTVPRLVLSLVVPGFSFADAGWKRLGLGVSGAWLLAGAIFVAFLGHSRMNLFWAGMMSLHVSSILFLVNRMWPGLDIRRRLILAGATVLIVSQAIYAPGLGWLQHHAFMPLQVKGRVIVVRHLPAGASIQRGDWVACHTRAYEGPNRRYIEEGYALSQVLARPGDQVEFSPEACRVNGIPIPRRPYMPSRHALTVPQNTWLIWPEFDTMARRNMEDDAIAIPVLGLALVPRADIIGKPCRSWFWHKQIE